MEIDFLLKNIKFTFYLTLIIAGILLFLGHFSIGFGILAGSFWNMVNFWFIIVLTRTLLPGKDRVNRKKMIALLGIKFPVLYGMGYLILKFSEFSLIGIFMGFSLLFFVMVVSAVGHIISQDKVIKQAGDNKNV